MASPQKENGYTAIANELMDALIKNRVPGEQMQCFLFIARKTWGWNKKSDDISLSQFVESTGICKPHVCRALNYLFGKCMISITKKGNGISGYAIQKDFEKWKALPKKVTLPKKVKGVTKKGKKTQEIVTKKGTHKRHNIKPSFTKLSREEEKLEFLVQYGNKVNLSIGKQQRDELKVLMKKGVMKIKYAMDRFLQYQEGYYRKDYRFFKIALRWNKFKDNIAIFLSDEALEERLYNETVKWKPDYKDGQQKIKTGSQPEDDDPDRPGYYERFNLKED